MRKIISDLPPNRFETRTRKAVTFETEPTPHFHVRRVTRYASDEWLRRGPLEGGSLPLSKDDLNAFYERKPVYSDSLLDWPLIRPILKFSIFRHQSLYILNVIDEKNTDSYMLKTRDWADVRTALHSLTNYAVYIPTPAILNVYNPFALYAPFDATPSLSDFESVNNGIIRSIGEAIAQVQASDCAGFLRGKVLAEYNRLLADAERLGAIAGLFSTPSKDDFENEAIEK